MNNSEATYSHLIIFICYIYFQSCLLYILKNILHNDFSLFIFDLILFVRKLTVIVVCDLVMKYDLAGIAREAIRI
jgi:hypothetical protein